MKVTDPVREVIQNVKMPEKIRSVVLQTLASDELFLELPDGQKITTEAYEVPTVRLTCGARYWNFDLQNGRLITSGLLPEAASAAHGD